METEAQKRAKANYNAKIKRFAVNFYLGELDLWDYLHTKPGRQTYIKKLIREDMEREKR